MRAIIIMFFYVQRMMRVVIVLVVFIAAIIIVGCVWYTRKPSEGFMTVQPSVGKIVVVKSKTRQTRPLYLNNRFPIPQLTTSFTVEPGKGYVAHILDINNKQTAFAEKSTTYPNPLFEKAGDIQYYRYVIIKKK